jgi:hypothetical protein
VAAGWLALAEQLERIDREKFRFDTPAQLLLSMTTSAVSPATS